VERLRALLQGAAGITVAVVLLWFGVRPSLAEWWDTLGYESTKATVAGSRVVSLSGDGGRTRYAVQITYVYEAAGSRRRGTFSTDPIDLRARAESEVQEWPKQHTFQVLYLEDDPDTSRQPARVSWILVLVSLALAPAAVVVGCWPWIERARGLGQAASSPPQAEAEET
jgi:hypothetical protein